MDSALLFLTMGTLALAFDRQIADATNQLSSQFAELLPRFRWPHTLPPGSLESYKNSLFIVRWWGGVMTLLGVGLGILLLLGY